MRSAIPMLIGVVLVAVASPALAAGASEMAATIVPEYLAARPVYPVHSLVFTQPVQMPALAVERRIARPISLVPLYATLGIVQAWDVCSTRSALDQTARETNPIMAPGSMPQVLAAKAATTAFTVFFVEHLRRQHPKTAVVVLALINGGTAAVATVNVRNARKRSR
jgi:hypothetical protein